MVSNEKSRILFSRNVSPSLRCTICETLNFQETLNLGKYLSVPILHGCTRKNNYQYIIDRIDSKLAGWKCKSLSLAGRVTLDVSILNAIPSYAMKTVVIRFHICNKIDMCIHNFVWGSLPEERKPHLLSWDIVCRPKEQGELGLRKAKEMNEAFLMKLVWNILSHPDELSQTGQSSRFKIYKGWARWSHSNMRGLRKVWEVVLHGIHIIF